MPKVQTLPVIISANLNWFNSSVEESSKSWAVILLIASISTSTFSFLRSSACNLKIYLLIYINFYLLQQYKYVLLFVYRCLNIILMKFD